MPYVSVLVVVYNGADTIEACLKNIRNSTYRDYELVVVDDGSQDKTGAIIKRYADRVISLPHNLGLHLARRQALKSAEGKIIVSVDADILIKPDSLSMIVNYFAAHQNIAALTGILSKEHPHRGFFSQYKNLYMHYIFHQLPEEITFLYGSIFALRNTAAHLYASDTPVVEDTAFGQSLIAAGKRIGFLRELEVVHLKRYTFFTFVKNDFRVPFSLARIFLRYRGWRQLARNKTGFAHSPLEQLLSLMLLPLIFILGVQYLLGLVSPLWLAGLLTFWFLLNRRFLGFFLKERGISFMARAFVVTFFDQLLMSLGGCLWFYCQRYS